MSSIRQGVLIISYIYISPTGPFVQKVDYAIHREKLYLVDSVLVSQLVHWIVIYPLDSAIQCLNNWGLKDRCTLSYHKIWITDKHYHKFTLFSFWSFSTEMNE